MARFKLVNGLAQMPDPDAPQLTDDEKKLGKKRASKLFSAGDIVESDIDLVAKHGGDKFQLVSGTPQQFVGTPQGAAAAPGGQVSSGIQATDGKTSGPLEDFRPETTDAAPVGPSPQSKSERNARLDKMSTNQLHKLAEEEEIDLTGLTNRNDILKRMKS